MLNKKMFDVNKNDLKFPIKKSFLLCMYIRYVFFLKFDLNNILKLLPMNYFYILKLKVILAKNYRKNNLIQVHPQSLKYFIISGSIYE